MFLGTKGERLSLRQQQLSKRLAAKVTADVDNDHTVTSTAVKVDENTTTDTEKIIKTNKRKKKEEKLSNVEKSSSIASKSREVKKKDVVNEGII